jgi:glycosyltransferase involved in cell wall biosynthesis
MKLSVIVCTHNRAHAIVPCLDSIAASLAHAAPVEEEIMVVDNASTDNTSAIVREWAKSCAFPVQLLFEPKKGLSAARNCALRNARGEILAWTDDDCRMDKNYVVALLKHDAEDGEELVFRGGRIELGDSTDLPLTIKTGCAVVRFNRRLKQTENLGNCVFGCNMTMRRALIDRLGFFDERFGAGTSLCAAEETDYIYRAYHDGLTVEYVPDMVVFHHHGRKSPADGYKAMRSDTISGGALYMKYLFNKPKPWRPARWFFRRAIKETVLGQCYYMPDIGFSYRDLIVFWGLGAVRYILYGWITIPDRRQ